MMHGTHNVTLTHCNMMHGTHNVTLTHCNMMHGTHNVTLTHCNMMHDTHNVKYYCVNIWLPHFVHMLCIAHDVYLLRPKHAGGIHNGNKYFILILCVC